MSQIIYRLQKQTIFLLAFLYLFFGCRKIDQGLWDQHDTNVSYAQLKQQFFNTATADPEVQKVAADIKKQDSVFKFLPEFIKKNGIPKWDKVLYKTTNSSESTGAKNTSSSVRSESNNESSSGEISQGVFFIPLQAQNSQEVKSYITAYKHNDSLYTYRLYNRDSLTKIRPGSDSTKQNMLNTQAVFGFFEKSLNNRDSIAVLSPGNGSIKDVTIRFDNDELRGNRNSNNIGTNSSANIESTCEISIGIIIEYEWRDFVYAYTPYGYWEAVSMTLYIDITCTGGGGGEELDDISGFASGGSNGTGNYWFNFGTGWPWNTNAGYGNNDLFWGWYWTSGVSNVSSNFSPTVVTLTNDLGLTHAQSVWLDQNLIYADIIYQFLQESLSDEDPITGLAYEFNYPDYAVIASKIAIEAGINNLIEGPYDYNHWNIISSHIPNSSGIDPTIYWMAFKLQCALIKSEHPSWGNFKVSLEAGRQIFQLTLDLAGLIPVVGEVADLLNAGIYVISGDGVNATLSLASAIPFGGWYAAGIKFAKRGVDLANGGKTTLKWLKRTDGIIDFGERGQLRKVLGLATGDSRKAHHIIPWDKANHPAVQKAAKGNDAFHLNELLNGIPLNQAVHNGNHTAYLARVQAKLDAIPTNLSPSATRTAIESIINDIKTVIQNNPNTHIDNLIF